MAKIEAVKAVESEDVDYVIIPDKDLFDCPFPGIWNNKDLYKPGKHLLPKTLADSLNERLDVWRSEQVRQLRSNPDPRIHGGIKTGEDPFNG